MEVAKYSQNIHFFEVCSYIVKSILFILLLIH